jgi:hypothetical protein
LALNFALTPADACFRRPFDRCGGIAMARTIALVLTAAVLTAVVLAVSATTPAAAVASDHAVVALEEDDGSAANPYAGTEGRSPLEDVPVLPMVGATAAILVTLSVIAFRRGWI